MRLYRQMFDVQESLARTNINFFIQYVLQWEGREEYVKQTAVHVALQKHIDENQQSLIWGAVGIGKAQPLHCKVLTPTGWRAFSEIRKGEWVVDPNGGVGRVVSLTPVETRTVYEVTLSGGQRTFASDDHLWQCYLRHGSYRARILNTQQLAEIFSKKVIRGTPPPCIPVMCKPWEPLHPLPPVEDPYLLGFVLSGAVGADRHFKCSPKLHDHLRTLYGDGVRADIGGYEFVGPCATAVDRIYHEYRLARNRWSVEFRAPLMSWSAVDRAKFLSGWADGAPIPIKEHHRATRAIYNPSNIKILVDAMRSVGWQVYERKWKPKEELAILGFKPGQLCFSAGFSEKVKSADDMAYIVSMVKMKPEPVRCINVSTYRNLYITDDYIITHNCVTSGTEFIDGDGVPVTGEELHREYELGIKNYVLDFDVERLRPRYVPVKSVEVNGVVPCTRLRLEDGRRTLLSNNHPIYASPATPSVAPWFEEAASIKSGRLVATHNYVAKTPPEVDYGKMFVAGFTVGACISYFSKTGNHNTISTTGEYSTDSLHRRSTRETLRQRMMYLAPLYERLGAPLELRKATIVIHGASKVMAISGHKASKRIVHKDRPYMHVRYESYRGRKTLLTPEAIKGGLLPYVSGLFYSSARWSELPSGIFKIQSSDPRVKRTIIQGLRACGVATRRVNERRRRRNRESYVYIESESGARFLDQLAEVTSPKDRIELRAIADGIRRRAAEPLTARGRNQKRNPTGLLPWSKREDPRFYKFTRVSGSKQVLRDRLTYAVEVDSDTHTFVTDGIVTHNTQQVSVARTLFWLGQNPNYRILIFMSSQDMAKDTLRQIKNYITTSARYRKVFPHVQPGSKWSEYEILVKRQFESLTPSVRVIGTSTMIDGSRYDKIIGDDALSLKNTQTEGERDRTHTWIETVPLSRMAEGCQVVIIGNAFHNNDSMHRLERLPAWKARRFPARDPVTKQTLMPDIWPQHRLELWERMKSPSEVRRAIDVIPWTNESSRFKIEWFEGAFKRGSGVHKENGVYVHFRTSYDLKAEQDRVRALREKGEIVPMPLDVVAGIDVGFGQTEHSDETAILCGAPMDSGDLLVLYYRKGRIGEVEKFEEVYRLHANYNATIFVEANFTQDFFYNQLKDAFPEALILPWRTRGDGTVGNKWHTFYGVASLEFDYARGKVILPCIPLDKDTYEVAPEMGQLVDAFLAYTPDTSMHTDDGIMAHWIMSQGARIRGGTEYLAGLIGRHGVLTDSAYEEYLDEEMQAAPQSSGIDASSIWETASPMLRKLGISRPKKVAATDSIVIEDRATPESS